MDKILNLASGDYAVLLVLGASTVALLMRRSKGPLPPGPMALPLLGNLLQMPRSEEWNTYAEWAKKYESSHETTAGDITYLTLFGNPMIILNSLKVVRELMNERSANYSNRPYSVMNELCGLTWILTNADGEAHRVRRSIVQRYFSGLAAVKHRSHQQDEARVLANNLLKSPELIELHLKGHAASSILLGAYGFRVEGAKDRLVQQMDETSEHASRFPGFASFLLEKVPAMRNYPRWMPFSGFRAYGDLVTRIFQAIRADPYERTMKLTAAGKATPSFVSTSLDDLAAETSLSDKEREERVELIKDCACVMYGAGTESSTATMGTFCMMLALHPEILKRAQEELDKATGGERLPTFDDERDLPYIDALFWETLRYNTVTPLGLPHRVVNDDYYEGTLIPAGTTIVGNMWYASLSFTDLILKLVRLIFRDPTVFTNPDQFTPERFLGEKGKQCRDVLTLVWGMGRRACPGRQLAEASLFITMATIASCFDITPKSTNSFPQLEFSSGFVRRPKLFPVNINPRSSKWKEILEREFFPAVYS
ncbi:hypothetical protein Clacol_003150 [Clathrus columnatus]|uniref:Cytochrome P450 n=1 Tax=Clathrus columnatus TaxID=1419009 RepID=A0AAV5A7H8_9AGAM|nr:hypothetical protein Clacol_003150 [Clathrus columnatus]